jgi:hypothetical protein
MNILLTAAVAAGLMVMIAWIALLAARGAE